MKPGLLQLLSRGEYRFDDTATLGQKSALAFFHDQKNEMKMIF